MVCQPPMSLTSLAPATTPENTSELPSYVVDVVNKAECGSSEVNLIVPLSKCNKPNCALSVPFNGCIMGNAAGAEIETLDSITEVIDVGQRNPGTGVAQHNVLVSALHS